MKPILVFTIVVPFLLSRSPNNPKAHRIHYSQPTEHTQREMVISFSDLPTSTTDDDSLGYDMRLLLEEHFNASDADGDGLLNLAKLNDFLHSANSNNPKLQQWLCKEEVRESDMDRVGKVSFIEFFFRLLLHLAQDDKDWHLSLAEMIEIARILYAAIFTNEFN